jgi:hypothetical protein
MQRWMIFNDIWYDVTSYDMVRCYIFLNWSINLIHYKQSVIRVSRFVTLFCHVVSSRCFVNRDIKCR